MASPYAALVDADTIHIGVGAIRSAEGEDGLRHVVIPNYRHVYLDIDDEDDFLIDPSDSEVDTSIVPGSTISVHLRVNTATGRTGAITWHDKFIFVERFVIVAPPAPEGIPPFADYTFEYQTAEWGVWYDITRPSPYPLTPIGSSGVVYVPTPKVPFEVYSFTIPTSDDFTITGPGMGAYFLDAPVPGDTFILDVENAEDEPGDATVTLEPTDYTVLDFTMPEPAARAVFAFVFNGIKWLQLSALYESAAPE